MKVFISWSGERARAVAESLRDWLPDVIQSIEPWVSSEDIGAGERWNTQIAKELSETRFGIICVTPESQQAPWLLFETGALAKTIEDTNVCPYLIGLEKSDLKPGPLTQFQAMDANEKETWKLIRTINNSSGSERLEETRLQRIFERSWSILEERLSNLPEINQNIEPKRDNETMTEEILELVRGIARGGKSAPAPRKVQKLPLRAEDFWSKVLIRADTQLRELLVPAEVRVAIGKEWSHITLRYTDADKDSFSSLEQRRVEFERFLEATIEDYVTINVLSPDESFDVHVPF